MTDEVDPEELKFVGPTTAEVVAAADFTAAQLRDREVSFRMLREAGVNPGVAARIRREHSLPWSFETEDESDLERRSDQIRGLNEGEREWVAASSGDWEADADEPTGPDAVWESSVETEADGSGDPVAAESAWQDRSGPTAVSELAGVDAETERALATAGVTSVRSLSVADPDALAEALDLDADRVAELKAAADRHVS